MPTTTIQSLPYPAGSDVPDGPAAFQALAEAVETKLNLVFDSATDRTTLLTSPTEGMRSYLKDVNRTDLYDGAAWVPTGYLITPRCHAYVSASQSHNSSGSWLLVNFDGEAYDTDTMHSTGTNPSRVFAKTAGLYNVNASIFFDYVNNTGIRMMMLRKNSASSVSSGTQLAQDRSMAVTSVGTPLNVAFDITLAVNDYIEMFAYSNAGATIPYGNTNSWTTFLQLRWVSS